MADSFISLATLVSLNDKNAVDLGVTDLFNDAPMVKVLAATVASNGTLHKYIKESSAPTVGFRAVNTGQFNSVSGDTLVTATLSLLDASFDTDKAIADAYRGGPDAYIAREAKRHLKQSFFTFEKQILGGTISGSASGFSGLANALSAIGTYCLDAGGTTAATGSSVYLIRHNNDGMDVQSVIGNDGQIVVDQTVVSTVQTFDSATPPASTGRFTSYHTPIMGYVGLQVGGAASVVRIANLTADSGKGLTDAKIALALAAFPASRQPNMIVMNRRSLQQLQSSRTATNPTGAPAPFPQDAFGIPIIVTDAIGSTEALLS